MKFFKKRSNLFVTGIALAAIIGGAWYFTQTPRVEASATPELQTTKVRTGDLVITANGAGTVVPAAQVSLGFRSSGVLAELNVSVGDAVTSAEVLARLEANIQAESDFQALFTTEGVAWAELAVANAAVTLDSAESGVIYIIGWDAWYWEGQMEKEGATQAEIDTARIRRDYFLSLVSIDKTALALARANLESARVALQDAQAALEIVQAGPGALNGTIAALGPQMARLEQARLAVENTRLVAPFDGAVTSLSAIAGQAVGTSPILSLATTHDLLVRFYLDETDVDKAAVGNPVTFTFDAYPDETITGEIILVEPVLQTVDGTPVVVAWASLPEDAPFAILSGMTVEAEVIAAEARNTLLVPVQALRELAPGSYAVFVLQADGSLKMTPVTVGLRDFANAEILSGLKVGDVVSTGTVETK